MKLRYVAVAVVVTATLLGPAAASTTPPGHAAEPVQLSGGAQDILKLSRAKVNDDVTVAFIKNGARRFDLAASEIVYLRQEGVSDRVLATMLNHQPEPLAASAPAPATPTPAPVASAPQYVEPPATGVAETAATSTVYVVPSTPSYYSFYDPSPYWYDPWPYYGYGYPYFSFGWGWGWGWGWGYGGNCYYGYYNDCWGNDYCDNNGNYSSGNHSQKSDGQASSSTRVPPTRGEADTSGQSGALASGKRPAAGMKQSSLDASRTEAARSANTSPSGRTTSNRSNGNQPNPDSVMAASSPGTRSQIAGERSAPASRAVASPASRNLVTANSAAGNQSPRPTTTWSTGANSRSVAVRPVESQGSAPIARGPSARPTSNWSPSPSQASAARSTVSQRPIAVAPSSRASTVPTTTLTSVGGQTANRYVARPTTSYTSYQRSSPSYSSRGGSTGASYSRPSMSAPARSTGSSSAVRSGGSYGGGGRSMSSGGASRGGGGGGRSR